MRWLVSTALIVVACLAASCMNDDAAPGARLRVAVTTSTRDSGLLDVLVPEFEQAYACRVDVVAVGTGRALKLGESGDVDVILVHARPAEDAFMAAGHGVRREDVMYNTFIVLGPSTDPADVAGLAPIEAMRRIAAGHHPFVSRGDDSGTHDRERRLWELGGGRSEWSGYIESGRGMGATLVMADQVGGYVLCDRGTYLRFRDKVELVPVVEAPDELLNPYGAIVVNPAKHPAIERELAERFVDFLVSEQGQRVIQDFRIDGEPLFHPSRSRG
jgi:tungstate transport system substrate-binding protein